MSITDASPSTVPTSVPPAQFVIALVLIIRNPDIVDQWGSITPPTIYAQFDVYDKTDCMVVQPVYTAIGLF